MTQSKDNKITVSLDDDFSSDNTITIDLNNTYGTTTTYWAGDSISDIVVESSNDGAYTIDINDLFTDTIDISNITSDNSWAYESTVLDRLEVERMCEHYPALEKAWRNFKSIYDMTKQDYEGKKKSGEIDDDIPF